VRSSLALEIMLASAPPSHQLPGRKIQWMRTSAALDLGLPGDIGRIEWLASSDIFGTHTRSEPGRYMKEG